MPSVEFHKQIKFRIPKLKTFGFIICLTAILNTMGQDQNAIDSLQSLLLENNLPDTERIYTRHELGMQYYLSQPDMAVFHWRKNLKEIDSLLKFKLAQEKKSLLQSRAFSLGALAYMMQGVEQQDTAVMYMTESFKTFVELGDLNGATQVLNNLSSHYSEKADYKKSVELSKHVVVLGKASGNYKTVAFAYQNIGIAYRNWGNYPAAIENFQLSLKIRDSLQDHLGLGYAYFDLAVIYKMMKETDYALLYFLKSLHYRKLAGDIAGMGSSENEIASIFLIDKKDIQKAELFLKKARMHSEKMNDFIRLGFLYTNIGNFFIAKNESDSASRYYQMALLAREKCDDKRGIALAHFSLGKVSLLNKDYQQVIKEGEIAYESGKKQGDLEILMKSSDLLHRAYSAQKQWEKAYQFLAIHKKNADSVLNGENQRMAIKNKLSNDFEKKQNDLKAQQEKETLRMQSEKKKQQIVIVFSLSGLILVIAFAIILYSRFNVIKKQKQIIEAQKHIVEEKQGEILDSIHYASRIQKALITSEKYIDRTLKKFLN